MKKIYLILFLFVSLSCAQNLKIMWQAAEPDSQDLKYYTVYKFEGDSINVINWQISDMDSIGILSHVYFFYNWYQFETFFQKNKIIRGGVTVTDSLGRTSLMGLTKFYYPPDYPHIIKIEK